MASYEQYETRSGSSSGHGTKPNVFAAVQRAVQDVMVAHNNRRDSSDSSSEKQSEGPDQFKDAGAWSEFPAGEEEGQDKKLDDMADNFAPGITCMYQQLAAN